MDANTILKKYLKVLGISANAGDFLTAEEQLYVQEHLTHKEERSSAMRDEWGNWDYQFTKYEYNVPYVDRFVISKANNYNLERRSIWPEDKPFAFCLTHDLDAVSETDFRQLSRRYRKLADSTGNLTEKMRFMAYYYYTYLKSVINPVEDDPIWHFENWIETELQFGFTSTYFIYLGENNLHKFDCDVLPGDIMKFRGNKMMVKDYVKSLAKEGFEIGIHGSYLTYNDHELLKRQKEKLESIIESPVIAARQHYLHYDIDITPVVQKKSGIKVDSTLGFNRAVGFRAGTCFPYYLENELIEIPLIMMDGALFNENSLALDEKLAFNKIIEVINHVEEAGGCLVVNFHPNYLNRTKWWNAYVFMLKELHSRNAWCANMGNINKIVEEACAE